MEPLMTADDVCMVLAIKKSTLYGWIHKKKIQVVKLGGVKFRTSDIEGLIFANSNEIPHKQVSAREIKPAINKQIKKQKISQTTEIVAKAKAEVLSEKVFAGPESRLAMKKKLPKGLYRPKSSKTIWMTYSYQGKSYRESTGTDNVKLAQKIIDNIRHQIAHDKFLEYDFRKKTFKELIDKFRDDKGINAREKSHIRFLTEFFGENATLKQIDERCGEYEAWRRKTYQSSNGTIVKDLGFLRRIFNIARKQWKWKVDNPVSSIELPEVNNKRIRYLNHDELARMLDALESSEKWFKHCALLALYTGMRVDNILKLKWSEINLEEGVILKDYQDMKNQEYLGIPINQNARASLDECAKVKCLSGLVIHDNGEEIYYMKLNRAFREARTRAKIENFRFHDFRHCFCSYLRQHGLDLPTIGELVGHKDIRSTLIYAHLNVDSLKKSSAKLDDFFTIFSKKREKKKELSA